MPRSPLLPLMSLPGHCVASCAAGRLIDAHASPVTANSVEQCGRDRGPGGVIAIPVGLRRATAPRRPRSSLRRTDRTLLVQGTLFFEFVNRIADDATSGRLPDGPGATFDHQDAAATAALTRLNRRNWYEARAMNKTSPASTPSTMDAGVTRLASCRARAIPVPAIMQFTVKIAEDIVNTTPRRDDRVPISSSSWTAVRSVGCGKKYSAPGSSVA